MVLMIPFVTGDSPGGKDHPTEISEPGTSHEKPSFALLTKTYSLTHLPLAISYREKANSSCWTCHSLQKQGPESSELELT